MNFKKRKRSDKKKVGTTAMADGARISAANGSQSTRADDESANKNSVCPTCRKNSTQPGWMNGDVVSSPVAELVPLVPAASRHFPPQSAAISTLGARCSVLGARCRFSTTYAYASCTHAHTQMWRRHFLCLPILLATQDPDPDVSDSVSVSVERSVIKRLQKNDKKCRTTW